MENMFTELNKLFYEIDPEIMLELTNHITYEELPENHAIIKAGDKNYAMSYIKQGLVQVIYTNEKSENLTMYIRWEDQFVAAHDTIFFDAPARYSFITLEKTQLFTIDYKKYVELSEKYPSLHAIERKFLQFYLHESIEKYESFIVNSPQERVETLFKENKFLLNRVADKHLATLLGITPVSLSRIKRRILTS